MLWLILKVEILKGSKNSCFQPEAVTTRHLLRSGWKIFSRETFFFTRALLSARWLQNAYLPRVCISRLKGSTASANRHLSTQTLNLQAQVWILGMVYVGGNDPFHHQWAFPMHLPPIKDDWISGSQEILLGRSPGPPGQSHTKRCLAKEQVSPLLPKVRLFQAHSASYSFKRGKTLVWQFFQTGFKINSSWYAQNNWGLGGIWLIFLHIGNFRGRGVSIGSIGSAAHQVSEFNTEYLWSD